MIAECGPNSVPVCVHACVYGWVGQWVGGWVGGREVGCVGAGIWGFSRSLSGLGEG